MQNSLRLFTFFRFLSGWVNFVLGKFVSLGTNLVPRLIRVEYAEFNGNVAFINSQPEMHFLGIFGPKS